MYGTENLLALNNICVGTKTGIYIPTIEHTELQKQNDAIDVIRRGEFQSFFEAET